MWHNVAEQDRTALPMAFYKKCFVEDNGADYKILEDFTDPAKP